MNLLLEHSEINGCRIITIMPATLAFLSSDLLYEILSRLDGATLTTAACACKALCSISKEETLWENVCSSLWPSTNRDDVKQLISSLGGFKKFYADCFPFIVYKKVPEFHWHDYHDYPQEWLEDDDDDDVEDISPLDFVSIVDIRYKEHGIFSKVLWGIPDARGFDGWFHNCPFRIDLLTSPTDKVTIFPYHGLPRVLSMERERKDGKLFQDLLDNVRLSWILVNTKTKKAANFSSWGPIVGQRHWPTENDFLIRFGSILPAKDITIPCEAIECVLTMKLKLTNVEAEEGPRLALTELSMQLGDMEGSHINGRKSLLVLRESLCCHKSKNYGDALESCLLYSKARRELKEEKMRYENRLDAFLILGSIAACSITYCLYCL